MNPRSFRLSYLTGLIFTVAASIVPQSTGSDPTVTYATYIGGTEFNGIVGADVDGAGNIYVVGHTSVPDFPGVTPQGPGGGSFDIFAARIDPNEGVYDWVTLIGGTNLDLASGFKFSNGKLYIVGETFASGFPTVDPVQANFGGGFRDGVAIEMDTLGTILFSTYIGGSGDDRPQAVDLGPNGEFVISGMTDSPNFPTLNPIQPTIGGNEDAFVYVLDPQGEMLFSTFYGGSDRDRSYAVAVDGLNQIWFGGETYSSDLQLENPIDDALGGSNPSEGFFGLLSGVFPSGDDTLGLSMATYLGGSGFDQVMSMSTDTAGLVALVGSTSSTDLPTLNAFQPNAGGGGDAFVGLFEADGSPLTLSYIGTEDSRENGRAIAIIGLGCALTVGDEVTFGTSNQRLLLVKICSDGTSEDLDNPWLASPSSVVWSGAVKQAIVSGIATQGGITPTAGAVQPEPPTEDEDSNKNNGFVAIVSPPTSAEQATLEVTKTPSKSQTYVGATVDWVIEVTNTGNVEATNVLVKDSPRGLRTRNPETRQYTKSIFETSDVEWNIPSVPPGMTHRLELKSNVSEAIGSETDVGMLQPAGIAINDVTARAENSSQASFSDTLEVSNGGVDAFLFYYYAIVQLGPDSLTYLLKAFWDSVLVAPNFGNNLVTITNSIWTPTTFPVIDIESASRPGKKQTTLSKQVDLTVQLDDSTRIMPVNQAILVNGDEDGPTSLAVKPGFRRESIDPAQVDFFLINFSDTDIDLATDDGTGKTQAVVFSDIGADSVSDYASFAPAFHTFLLLSPTDGSRLGRFKVDWSGSASDAFQIVLTGVSDSLHITTIDGNFEVHDPVAVSNTAEIPENSELRLRGNYPNPFVGTTSVHFDVAETGLVHIDVFDVLGRIVVRTEPKLVPAGEDQSIDLDGTFMSSGTYFYRLISSRESGSDAVTGSFVVAR